MKTIRNDNFDLLLKGLKIKYKKEKKFSSNPKEIDKKYKSLIRYI